MNKIKKAVEKGKKMIEKAANSETGKEVIRKEKRVMADMMAEKAKEMKEETIEERPKKR